MLLNERSNSSPKEKGAISNLIEKIKIQMDKYNDIEITFGKQCLIGFYFNPIELNWNLKSY